MITHEEMTKLRDTLSTMPSAEQIRQSEWVLVPREPDMFMRAAGQWTISENLTVSVCVANNFKATEIYKAMIGACKNPPDIIAENERMRNALMAIANETEIHTKLNQERLCCKFQDIAMNALAGEQQ